jgi:hypothetical protein
MVRNGVLWGEKMKRRPAVSRAAFMNGLWNFAEFQLKVMASSEADYFNGTVLIV